MSIEKSGQSFDPADVRLAQGILYRILGNLDQSDSLIFKITEKMAEDLVEKGQSHPDYNLTSDQARVLQAVAEPYLAAITDAEIVGSELDALRGLINAQVESAHLREVAQQQEAWRALVGRVPLIDFVPQNYGRPITSVRYQDRWYANKSDPSLPELSVGGSAFNHVFKEYIYTDEYLDRTPWFRATPISPLNKATNENLGPNLALILAGLSVKDTQELSVLLLVDDVTVNRKLKEQWENLFTDFQLVTRPGTWAAALAGGVYGRIENDPSENGRKYVERVKFARAHVKSSLGIDTQVLFGPPQYDRAELRRDDTNLIRFEYSSSLFYLTSRRKAVILQPSGRPVIDQSFKASEIDAITSLWSPSSSSLPSELIQRLARFLPH